MPKTPGSGRKKGTPNKGIDIRNPVVAHMVAEEMRAAQADPSRRKAIEILSMGANLMMGIVAQCRKQELDPRTGVPVDPVIADTFWKAFDKAMVASRGLSAHESPTFKAVHLAIDQGMANADRTKTIELKIFEDTGTALGLMEVLKDADEA